MILKNSFYEKLIVLRLSLILTIKCEVFDLTTIIKTWFRDIFQKWSAFHFLLVPISSFRQGLVSVSFYWFIR